MTAPDVRFDIKARDDTQQAWQSAANRAKQFNGVMGNVEKRIGAASRGFTGSSKAIKLNNAQLQNLSFQLNDIGVMLASGQSPFVMMMQQGMQIGQIFGPGAGLAGAMKAVGTGMMKFITNPINIAVVGVAALAGGVGLLWDTFSGGGEKQAEAALKRHQDWISGLGDGYRSAQKAAQAYQKQAEKLPQSVQIADGREAAKVLQAEYDQVKNRIIAGLEQIEQRGKRALRGTAGEIVKLVKKFRGGEITAKQLQSAMANIRLDDEANRTMKRLALAIQKAAGDAASLEIRIQGVVAGIREISGIRINPFPNLLGIGKAVEQIRAMAPELRTNKQLIDDIYRGNVAQARTMGEVTALTKAYKETNTALVEQKRREDALTASRKLATSARRDARDASRELAEAKRNEFYLADLAEEVRILGLSYHERVEQLKILNEERKVRQAIARLGKGANGDQVAMVRRLIPQRLRLLDANRQDRRELQLINQQWGQMGNTMGSALAGVLNKTKSIKQAVIEMALEFAKMALQAQIFNTFGKSSPAGSFLSSFVSSIFSFDGGGYTGSGSRSGGLDGKGGFQAMLHPQETVIDHTKGQRASNDNASNVHVTTDVNISFDDDGKMVAVARSEVSQAIQYYDGHVAPQRAVQSVLDYRKAGGAV